MPEGSHQTSSIEAMLHIRAGRLTGHQGMQPQTQTEAACLALGCATHEGSAPQRTQREAGLEGHQVPNHFIKQLEWKHTYVHLHINVQPKYNILYIVQIRCIGTVQVSLWCECALTSASEGSWPAISCAISSLSCSAPTLSTGTPSPFLFSSAKRLAGTGRREDLELLAARTLSSDFCRAKQILEHIELVCVCVRACVRACVHVCVCVFGLTANLLFTLDSLVLRSGGGWVFLLVQRLYLQWSTSNAPVPVLQQGAHLRPHTVLGHYLMGEGQGRGRGKRMRKGTACNGVIGMKTVT